MIIRVGDGLRKAVFQAPKNEPEMLPVGQAAPPDLSYLVEFIPEWLKEEMGKGDVIVLDREDYCLIPPEILEHITVLKP